MLEFLLLSLFWFMKPVYFFFFVMLFSFLIFNNFSWGGLFFVVDSYSYVLLVIMSVFILGIILMSEKNNNLLLLSELLVFICILFFIPSNMMMLYMFFELSMFPILVMILGYGSQIEKINSSYYLMFYASFCSFPFLFVYFKSDYYFTLTYFDFFLSWEMFFILSLSFMMKFPIYFLHLWLPKAHVEAPTTASMLLAGLLLKLGTAGFLRILGSMNFIHNNIWIIIAFLGMILGSFCCVFQSDSKSLAAYSSVTHMGFLLLSLVFISMSGKVSSLMLMLAHGYTSTLMFYMIGEYYHTMSTRMIYFMNSFFSSSMIMGILFSLVFLSNSGVPPSLSFISEFMVISNGFLLVKFMFFLLFMYFLVSFYYSLFLITNSLMGKSFINFNNWNVGFSVPMVLMMYNVFWLSVLY
uniref:NADH-ubiquinone oxidoreductase chain 4 n=7 Tax=Heterorhabditis TaxID=37861 RepID=A0A312_HETBA|nr:NADH dehydrogenase subunit 4 [Heterorhabditis indica]YP_817459.1 NADH dehydrogenase subunit 4 [Heterorhabditis bacteriophora]ABJ80703.1 NADH dehydrogenase subunit 4 [Heterorhabditis bacteriophora]AZU95944.1 NADH dehydrogenase subunit 4 [Heterorhabditis bacteriophora]QAA11089.1 NADH dehydrogenase subunit 4 [Heterorhabditis indica]QAA11101.1 NADH dehydrogenase subunit 4 [Heterorhabditis bacteriophora]